jgi:hypothetical protein
MKASHIEDLKDLSCIKRRTYNRTREKTDQILSSDLTWTTIHQEHNNFVSTIAQKPKLNNILDEHTRDLIEKDVRIRSRILQCHGMICERFSSRKDTSIHRNVFHIARYSIVDHLVWKHYGYYRLLWLAICQAQTQSFPEIEKQFSRTALSMFLPFLHVAIKIIHHTCKHDSCCERFLVCIISFEQWRMNEFA